MIGFSRGAVREVVTLVSFTLAVLAAVFLLPISHPLARALVHPVWASKLVAIAVVFLVAYIALRIVGAAIAAGLHRQAAFGALDRGLGFVIGAGRGLVALGLCCLVFAAVTPAFLQPDWIVGSPLYGVGRASGRVIARLAPSGLKAVGGFGQAIKDQVAADTDGPPEPVGAPALEASPQDGTQSSPPTPPNSSDPAPYAGHRHGHRRASTLNVINRPAE